MEILDILLFNWRNFTSRKISFSSDLTVIVGQNGVGKSNILEGVGYLSGIRPTRVQTDADLIRFGETEARLEATVKGVDAKTLTVNFQLSGSFVRKSYLIDSIRKRLVDLSGELSVIVFHPQDLDLVSGSPSLRRHHLDVLLSSIDPAYFRAVSAYGKVLTRRNRVLARIAERIAKPMELDFWDSRLVEHGVYVSQRRHDFFEYLNFVEPTLSKEHNQLTWNLKQSVISIEKLIANRNRDIDAGMTLSGPHRDDFRFFYKGRDLEFFGSRGEQRMAVLKLKLSELEYFASKRGVRPVIALDDIFSELDWEHRETVLEVIGNQQTIITAAEAESLPKEIFEKAKVVELR